jgi:hypothetical protein
MREGSSAPTKRPGKKAVRRNRRQATIYRQRRIRFAVGFAAVCVLIVVFVVVALAAGQNRSRVSPEELLAGGRPPTAPVSATGEERPAFARFGNENLLLPVAAANATIIAYQPVSDDKAVALTPIGQRVNTNAFARFFTNLFSSEPSVRYYQLPGEEGEPTTSVLVGAPPDAAVTSPIDGVVVGVREYLLFGKYDDVQIDLRPTGMGGITVTLMFINNPAISIGQRVDKGKTLLGTVRRCPEEVGKTLADYTHDTGSHIYLQVSEEPIS